MQKSVAPAEDRQAYSLAQVTAEADRQEDSLPSGIDISGLTVAFNSSKPVLDGLDLSVQPGEIVSLVGASGCGKSTLLRSIAGLIEPSSGSITIAQHSTSRRPGDLAFVFQDPTLLPWRTVWQNVRLPLELGQKVRSTSNSLEPSIEQALAQVGLDAETFGKYPRELSGGMRMRTSIARALVTEPTIMLLDEPFAALDDLLRCRLNDLLLELWHQKRRTIVFVTHNIAEAVYLSHRIAVFGKANIASVIDNQLDWPRSAPLRTTVRFAEMYGRISQALAEAGQ